MRKNDPSVKSKILCVDDDPVTLALYQKYLNRPEYEIKTAGSAEDGLGLARKFMPDLIVSDVVMPGASGVEFCQKVRNDPTLAASIFILASSKKVESVDTVEGLEGGADDYLVKPVRKEEFLAKIKAFLRIKSLQDELVHTNKNLEKAVRSLKGYKIELEKKNQTLLKEKQMIQNSLKQISLMVEERERSNSKQEKLNRIHEGNFKAIVTILAAIIDSKRQYHRGHSRKVAEIATFIARELKLSRKEIRNIEIASLLHELGKLSIPDQLSMKSPEEYSQPEKDFLVQHPVKGAALLEKFAGFGPIAKIIRHFHENFDGTGVPDGLQGEEIPIGSRIIDAAGVFDNLANRKKEVALNEAFARIEEEIGTRFDPRVVQHLHRYTNMHPPDEGPKTRELSIYELEPGMTLAAGIFTASGTKLLPMDTVLREESINQIAQYNKIDPLEEQVFVKE